jgi:tumor protein p53-inducible protein 3
MASMKAIQTTTGNVTASTLVLGEAPKPVPSERQLLLKIHCTAINRADTLQRMGKYPVPAGESQILGLECSGEVVELASGCQGPWKVGDKVMALLGGGGYAEYAVADERSVMPIPACFSGDMQMAAAVPETWLTAYQLIHFVGKTQPGDIVLVHAAGSGVGLAACQLIKACGAIAIATARTASKLTTAAQLGASHTIDTSKDGWQAEISKAAPKGVNVILDCIGQSYSKANAELLAVDGRWVVYGLMSGAELQAEAFLGTVLRKRAALLGTTLRSRSLEYKGELCATLVREALPKFEDGTFKPAIDAMFRLEDAAKAHEAMEANTNTGKIILTVI